MLELNKIIRGGALETLKTFPDDSIDCVMTSPPYWNLRDYKIEGQLGLEPTFDMYIKHLCDIFDEVKRVLKKSGTCWVNLGDTYAGSGGAGGDYNEGGIREGQPKFKQNRQELESKSLCMIPYRFAIEMQNRNWILRNVIIWHKPNCMPSSAKDRFTVDFEPIFFFSKSRKYYFEPQYENYAPASDVRYRQKLRAGKQYNSKEPYKENMPYHTIKRRTDDKDGLVIGGNNEGRNKRTVWTITTKGFPEAHFATYPEELCETPIKAGCPEFVCSKCGKAREPIIEPSEEYAKILQENKTNGVNSQDFFPRVDNARLPSGRKSGIEKRVTADYKKVGLTKCSCDAPFVGGILLDPFVGSGTTCLVAKKLGRQYIGIELNPEYVKIANERVNGFQRKDWKAKKENKHLTDII